MNPIFINAPTKIFFEQKLLEAKLIINESNELWSAQSKAYDDKDFDLSDELLFQAEEKFNLLDNMMSVYLVIPFIDAVVDKSVTQQYDVSKISISSNTQKMFTDYDHKLVTLRDDDILSKNDIQSKVSMFHFMVGFSVSEFLEDDVILIAHNVLIGKIY
jgi:hypothetical protein